MAVVLDIDLDYFVKAQAHTSFSVKTRLSEDEYSHLVWKKDDVIDYIENHLGLSKKKKVLGRFIQGHNESLYFWEELMQEHKLETPFEVIHVDSHADLGLGQTSHAFLQGAFLRFPVEIRRKIRNTNDGMGITIGDYLLWAIGYQMISKITYCANPFISPEKQMDICWTTLKDFKEEYSNGKDIFHDIIQLKHNPNCDIALLLDDSYEKIYLEGCTIFEPEVPLTVIPTIKDVKFDGNFDYITVAKSPNYTPASADYILDILKEYMIEI